MPIAQTNSDDHVLATLLNAASGAHEALMRGDLVSYRSQLSMSPDFVLMAPFGGPPTRPANLSEQAWAAIAAFFEDGHESSFELVQAYPSKQMVVLAGIERTRAKVGGLDLQPWALRVTLVFTEHGGQWRLAHRHADPLVDGISLRHAAELSAGRCKG
jgi:ketosteroid isomerase-like protein